MDRELLWTRARIIRQTRAFFDGRAYLEVDTPLLAPNLIPESCLEVFETAYLPPFLSKNRKDRQYWLVPSPEIWMKQLIADHGVSLYQICKCFRNGESLGRLHSPEFTMLEYYTMDADYRDSLQVTEDLFQYLLEGLSEPERSALAPPFLRITLEEAFSRWAGFSLFDAAEQGTLEEEARRLGLEPPQGMNQGDLYNLIFVHAVEPRLPQDRAVALMDYPAFVPCLAKQDPQGKTVERWELYVRGIELANCYSEEADPQRVREYFTAEGARKAQAALVPHRIDADYWQVFLPRRDAQGRIRPFPPCSGVALGLDRLIMALTGRSTIDGVLPFPMEPRLD
ncbi:MAG: LysR family transcriptional regulator [Treponema sp.]|jgi:lysyl-tRNA synthetase class 2|nr:LysR family transcriptional regulator [Treponema sp.]